MPVEQGSVTELKRTVLLEPSLETSIHHSLSQSKLKGATRFRAVGNGYFIDGRTEKAHCEV